MSRKFNEAYAVAVGAAFGAWQGWWAVIAALAVWAVTLMFVERGRRKRLHGIGEEAA